jgi:diguanylate cyclase (GGDEF)-like protein
MIDPLTGLTNPAEAASQTADEIARAQRLQTPLSCILLGVNRLQAIDDEYGHAAGDRVLREIGAVLQRSVGPHDIVARWAGEEFLVVLPDIGLEQASESQPRSKGPSRRTRRKV